MKPEVGKAYRGTDGTVRWCIKQSVRGYYECLWWDEAANVWYYGGKYKGEGFPAGAEVRAPQPGERYIRMGMFGMPDEYIAGTE